MIALAVGTLHDSFQHPLGVKAFEYRRVKNDEHNAAGWADLLRRGRLPDGPHRWQPLCVKIK